MNTPELMEGPKDLWRYVGYEWENGVFSRAVFVRAALRKDQRDNAAECRERIADWLNDFHPMDLYPIRVLYRLPSKINYFLFGSGKQRETTWVCGVVLAVCVTAIAFRILAR